jgi:alpha-N-acetylglucosamine transferase
MHAFVTLVSSDSYLPGALAQVAALSDLHKDPFTVCLVTPESLDVATIRALRKAFNLVVGVEILEQDNNHGLHLLGRPDLTAVLTKLHVFRLTQFSKVIFLDADVLPIRPLDHLFSLPHEFSAVPDVGWPDIFNSGVMVLTPGEDRFAQLNQLLKSTPSWDGGDQGLLNEWRGGNWNRLSFIYNTTPTAAYTSVVSPLLSLRHFNTLYLDMPLPTRDMVLRYLRSISLVSINPGILSPTVRLSPLPVHQKTLIINELTIINPLSTVGMTYMITTIAYNPFLLKISLK